MLVMTINELRKFAVMLFVIIVQVVFVDNFILIDGLEKDFECKNEENNSSTAETTEEKFLLEIGENSINCSEFDLGFCTEDKNYPAEYISRKLKTNHKYNNFFIKSKKMIHRHQTISAESYSFSRQPDARPYSALDAGEPLCQSVSKSIYLKKARNMNDNWLFVVNQENLTQSVRVETCVNSGVACDMDMFFPEGYRSECKQEHSPRVLLAVNEKGEIIPDVFNLPSCCKCFLYRQIVVWNRHRV